MWCVILSTSKTPVNNQYKEFLHITVFLNCWNTISETLLYFLKPLNTKPHLQALFTKPLTPLAKWNFHLKTVLPVFKIKHCSQIINQVIKMIYTIKQSVNNTPKNRKPIVQNIVLREKYIFNLKTNVIFFRHCLLMNENMFYHSSSKLIRNYYSALLFAMFFVLPPPCTPIFTVLYPAAHKLVLCLCDTVILDLCWYEPATSQNLLSSQYC